MQKQKHLPIEDHGIIGDMRTAAIVGKNGSIDWFCYPRFDAPSIFANILDTEKGGSFSIHPTIKEDDGNNKHDDNDHIIYRQFYWPETNVLVTRFTCHSGVAEVRDFMPVNEGKGDNHVTQIVRQVVCVQGQNMSLTVRCAPAFDYARGEHMVALCSSSGDSNEQQTCATFKNDAFTMVLSAAIPLEAHDNGEVHATFCLSQGECTTFTFREHKEAIPILPLTAEQSRNLFTETVRFWRKWLSRCTYTGRWRERVYRSALVLKLLTYQPTGAIIASPTCSLPEDIGSVRNWDYRYVWIRDAAFTLYGFLRIGFTDEARDFMYWLMARAREGDTEVGPLQPLYGIGGESATPESTLDHLSGYQQSQPVRIGNAAYQQLQLDVYGELMDAVYLYNKYGSEISYDLWTSLRPMLDWVADNWQKADEGIWEVRGEKSNLVYSRLMCWVALDRGIRLADKRSFPAPVQRWRENRDAIYEEIMEKGYDHNMKAFTQSYEVKTLDASALIMPLVFFMAPSDPRMLNTIDAILKRPEDGGLTEDSLVYRYNPETTDDGLEGKEGTFNMCTFWLVEALTRAGRDDPERLDQARLMFERMLGYSNHLGLYAEETGDRGNSLGNFPQAFTHLSLISAAFNLDRTLHD